MELSLMGNWCLYEFGASSADHSNSRHLKRHWVINSKTIKVFLGLIEGLLCLQKWNAKETTHICNYTTVRSDPVIWLDERQSMSITALGLSATCPGALTYLTLTLMLQRLTEAGRKRRQLLQRRFRAYYWHKFLSKPGSTVPLLKSCWK